MNPADFDFVSDFLEVLSKAIAGAGVPTPRMTSMRIDKLIFQPELETTVIVWADGKRTVSKCHDGDVFSKEVGFAMAFSRRLIGSRKKFLAEAKDSYITEPEFALEVTRCFLGGRAEMMKVIESGYVQPVKNSKLPKLPF